MNYQTWYGHGDVVGVPFDFYIPLTGFAITMQTGILVLNPAGTLATGAVTLPLNPVDGAYGEISSTQTQTALTVSANTGDSIVGTAVTALVADTRVAYRYTLNGFQPASGAAVNPRSWVRVQ
ncbi:MAG: hypothetical protein ACRD6W_01365 [Nitrososphaerales archaeon]